MKIKIVEKDSCFVEQLWKIEFSFLLWFITVTYFVVVELQNFNWVIETLVGWVALPTSIVVVVVVVCSVLLLQGSIFKYKYS